MKNWELIKKNIVPGLGWKSVSNAELDGLKQRQQDDLNAMLKQCAFDEIHYTTTGEQIEESERSIQSVYYFHPDHLGSSTLLTDNFGNPYQFFLNLPFGESMAQQKASGNYSNPYLFNGKELDEETGLYYYGARYYNPRYSLWLGVDAMVEKYVYQSPYCYVGNRPINFIDPNGMDEWEVDLQGNISWKRESAKHTLHAINENGLRTGSTVSIKDRNILDQLSTKTSTAKGQDISKATGENGSQNDMIKTYLFLADNTQVEWRLDRFINNENRNSYAIGTLHNPELSPSAESLGHTGSSVITLIHSHPDTQPKYSNEISSMGWWENDKNVTISGDTYLKAYSNLANAIYYTYFPQSGRLWEVLGHSEPRFIRKIESSNRLHFGTLNTK